MLVTFHDAASVELAEAIDFYNSQASELGDSLGAEVYDIVAGIAENPAAGFVVRPGVHRRLLARFPYSVLYKASEGRLRVLAVMHHRRAPEYWADREQMREPGGLATTAPTPYNAALPLGPSGKLR